jgi:hypothetical protein
VTPHRDSPPLGTRQALALRLFLPIRPRIRADDSAAGAHHARRDHVDPRQGPAEYGTKRRSFRSRGDRPVRRARHRSPGFDRPEGTNSGPALSLATDASVTAGAAASSTPTTVISLPRTAPAFPSVRGVLRPPETKPTLKQETRDAILLATAKARAWIDDIASGRVHSFAEIAAREGKVERHIRLLTPLTFVPPRTLTAITDGTGPHDATVTALAQAVPYRWDGTPANRLSEQSSDGRRRSDHLQAHNRLVAGLSPTSPTTQSHTNPVSWRRRNSL